MSATPGLTRNRYVRLMAVSAVDIMGTVPLASFYLAKDAKLGVEHWRGWAYTHEGYSAVHQVPASIWKNNPNIFLPLEMFRWSLVLCSFLFFALFGFAEEARQNYRRVYTSIVNRIVYLTSALHKSSHACVVHLISCQWLLTFFFFSPSSVPYKASNGGITPTVVKSGGEKYDSSSRISLTDQSSIPPISITNDPKKSDFEVEQLSLSNAVTSPSLKSFHEPKTQDQSMMPTVVTMPTAPSATVPPHFPETTQSTLRGYSNYDAV
jgi:Pheromone A receptor